MSTPAVAGAAAMIRQYLEGGYHYASMGKANAEMGRDPSAALIKAMILNGASNIYTRPFPNRIAQV